MRASLHRLRHQAEKQREFSGQQQLQLQQPTEAACGGSQGPAIKAPNKKPNKEARRRSGSSGVGAGASTGRGSGLTKQSPARGGSQEKGSGAQQQRQREGMSFQCPVCLDDASEGGLCVTTCGHTFCTDCIHGLVDKSLGKCKSPG